MKNYMCIGCVRVRVRVLHHGADIEAIDDEDKMCRITCVPGVCVCVCCITGRI